MIQRSNFSRNYGKDGYATVVNPSKSHYVNGSFVIATIAKSSFCFVDEKRLGLAFGQTVLITIPRVVGAIGFTIY